MIKLNDMLHCRILLFLPWKRWKSIQEGREYGVWRQIKKYLRPQRETATFVQRWDWCLLTEQRQGALWRLRQGTTPWASGNIKWMYFGESRLQYCHPLSWQTSKSESKREKMSNWFSSIVLTCSLIEGQRMYSCQTWEVFAIQCGCLSQSHPKGWIFLRALRRITLYPNFSTVLMRKKQGSCRSKCKVIGQDVKSLKSQGWDLRASWGRKNKWMFVITTITH